MTTFLVTMTAVESRMPNKPSDMLNMVDTTCIPGLRALAQAESDGKILGGVNVGVRQFSFIMRSTSQEVERFVLTLPFWGVSTTEVVALHSFSERLVTDNVMRQQLSNMVNGLEATKLHTWFQTFTECKNHDLFLQVYNNTFHHDFIINTENGSQNFSQWLDVCINMRKLGFKTIDYKTLKTDSDENYVYVWYSATVVSPDGSKMYPKTKGTWKNGYYLSVESETPELYTKMSEIK